MRNIEVKVIHESDHNPGQLMVSLARLTQRGHNIEDMSDLESLFARPVTKEVISSIADLPHGTIKRFAPITIAIVGASRRFLAQARTHHVGMDFVSASLQYSDYTGKAQFVVPYPIIEKDAEAIMSGNVFGEPSLTEIYLDSCQASMRNYSYIAGKTDNDTAGYAAPQGLRNILIMNGNHEAWMNFINKRSCSRNTVETQYVTMLIWEALLQTADGQEMFKHAGPDCMYGACREGKMSCGVTFESVKTPTIMIKERWPRL